MTQKMYRPTMRTLENGYHIELDLKDTSYDKPRGCYINAHTINGELSNNEDAIRLDINPDQKQVKIFIDGKEYTGSGVVVVL